MSGSRMSLESMWTITMVVATFLCGPEPFLNSSKYFFRDFLEALRPDGPLRDSSAESLSPFAKIFHLGAVRSGPVEGGLSDLLVCKRYAEPGAEALEFLFVKLFLLVRYVLALPRFPRP